MNRASMTDTFLANALIHPDCVRPADYKKAFISDMNTGLRGESSSLLMLPTYLPAAIPVWEGETAAAVDIGGTNLKIAVLTVKNGQFEVLSSEASHVPGLDLEITKDMFFAEIAKKLAPYVGNVRRVGICFSHAAEILPDLDGRLLSFSKEIKVKNAGGVMVARELAAKLRSYGVTGEKKYTLLNDTTAALLGGTALTSAAARGGMVGFVLGTGMNLSYIEQTDAIEKLACAYTHDTMIINTETGGFSAMTIGPVDKAFDAVTADPDSHILEKMIGGRYLGELILFVLKEAVRAELLTQTAADLISSMDTLSTPDAGAFLSGRSGQSCMDKLCAAEEDRAVVMTVTDRVFERAAKLSALSISAVLDKTDAGVDPARPAVIVAEGSTINKQYSVKDRFLKYLDEQAGIAHRHIDVRSPDNATLIGTALAAFR